MNNFQIDGPVRKLTTFLLIIGLSFLAMKIDFGSYKIIYFLSGGFAWAPILATYLLIYIFFKRNYYSDTLYKILGIIVGDTLIFVYFHEYIGAEETFILEELYRLISVPIQLSLVVLIDLFGWYTAKRARRNCNAPLRFGNE